MSEKACLTGKCPKCMETLSIPEGLAEFSCLYCGARLTPDALVSEVPTPLTPDAARAQEEYAQAVGALVGCIRNYQGYNRKIVREQFEGAFAEYEAGTAAIFEALDRAVCAQEGQRAALLDAAAERFLDDLAAAWQADKNWKGKSSQRVIRDDDKIVLAIFFVPALRKQKLSISEELCADIQKKWVVRYPDSPFYLGDYESISGGFRKKILGLCFITTAVCEASGLPDDCAELTAFRAFRDGYLRTSEGGEALIEEYYDIAPAIVTCIDVCADREKKYADIRARWLEPCYRDLQAGRMERCKTRYTEMVRTLEREFFS